MSTRFQSGGEVSEYRLVYGLPGMQFQPLYPMWVKLSFSFLS